MNYRAVFFDWDDTLWDFTTNAREALQTVYEKHGFNRWYDSFEQYLHSYETYNQQLWANYAAGLISKDFLRRERFKLPLNELGIQTDDETALQLDRDFLQITASKTRLKQHAAELLQSLHGKVRIAVVSNGFTDVQHAKIQRSGLAPYIDYTILSEDVGVNKPHPDIFRYALTQCRLEAHEVLMVGDSYQTDIEGARRAGIDQFYLCPNPPADRKATYISGNLLDVRQIVGLTSVQ